jgi:hypothetical protein
MRVLEFKTTPEYPLPRFWNKIEEIIGESPYEMPDIFGYFLGTFQPDGTCK